MGKLTFGLILMIVGIGGTFLTLIILIWSIELLKKAFPLEPVQAQPTGQLLSSERISPQWRGKLPLDSTRMQRSEGAAQLQRASVGWMQRLPIDRLQYYWSKTLRMEWITASTSRRAIFSSVQARIFGRTFPPPPSGKASPSEVHDHAKQS